MSSPRCLRHRAAPDAALCQRCGEGLCDACWTFVVGRKPLCAQCVHDAEWRAQAHWSRFAVLVLISVGLAFWLSRHLSEGLYVDLCIAVVAAVGTGFAVTKASAAEATSGVEGIARRAPGAVPPTGVLELPAHPYRARLGRAAMAAVPTVSARTTAVVVGLLLAVTGVLLPVSLKLPRWVEFEIVLIAWWAVLFGALAVLLHRGTRVREDHEFRVRWNLPELGTERSTLGTTLEGWGWLDIAGCLDLEGCAGVLVGFVLVAVAIAAAWFVLELAFPAVFFLLYWLVVKAIADVANDRHGCEHNLGRAVAWGACWATLYTLPLALVVWAVHLIAARAHGG